jgi:hypothetical protein
MKRSEVPYGQLDQVLRSLGFTWHPSRNDPPGRVYEHQKTGSMILLPAFSDSEKVFEHHPVTVRVELANVGIADPTTFAAKLQKAG